MQPLAGVRIGARDSAAEREASTRAGGIAEAVAPLARAPRPADFGRAGMPLPPEVAKAAGDRLRADLSHVRLHDGPTASESARSAAARAYALGGHIVFGRGQFDPASARGRQLIAHELVHAAYHASDGILHRDEERPSGVVRMHFDGRELVVYDGDTERFRFAAQSGRPVLLRPEDARACGGDPVIDTYMNDRRFVGVRDFGPIPEGTYRFSPRSIQRFSFGEQIDLLVSGHTPVQTRAGRLTGGDWGEGRVALQPAGRLREGQCGNTNARSGFYLHGGWAAGSSGCIDIGGDFSTLADWLAEYRRSITVTVRYEHDAPSVGVLTGFSGAVAYSRFGLHLAPTLGLGAEFQGEATRFLIQPQVDAVLRWAGGAVRAGIRLEVPLSDRDQFVRLGLGGGLDLRLFRALFAQIYGGYSFALTDPARTGEGGFLGGGLQYDLGPVQVGLLYDHLWAAGAADLRVHRALLQLGVRFF